MNKASFQLKLFSLYFGFFFLLHGEAAPQLIGGELATSDQFRSILSIGGCTGTKVEDRLILLAAHCVIDPETLRLREYFLINKKRVLKTHFSKDIDLEFEKIIVHSSFRLCMQRAKIEGLSMFACAFKAYDLALVVTAQDIPIIKTASISYETLEPHTQVYIGGFGCTENIFEKTTSKTYKFTKTYLLNDVATPTDFHLRNTSRLSEFNFLTPGRRQGQEFASICPGDSGGGVFLADSMKLIGVNSQYLFEDESGISYLNTHTRLAPQKSWLQYILTNFGPKKNN